MIGTRGERRCGGSLVAVMLGLLVGLPIAAQETSALRGVVTEAGTDRRLVGAVVEIEELELRAITNSAGEFVFPAVPAGEFRLEVRQLGYMTVGLNVVVPREIPIRIGAAADPIPLEGIGVSARRLESAEREVRDRRNAHPLPVRYIGPEQIAASAGTADQLLQSAGTDVATCVYAERNCPQICIDDRPARGEPYEQFIELNSYPLESLHSVEVYPRSGVVRVYTVRFMEAVAMGREHIRSLRFCPDPR